VTAPLLDSAARAVLASRAIEAAGRRCGHHVQRLADDYLLLVTAHDRTAFLGLLGPSVTRPAVVLSEDVSMTRGQLELAGVPCVPAVVRLARQAAPAAEQLSMDLPLRLRPAAEGKTIDDTITVAEHAELAAAWETVQANLGRAARVVLEPDRDVAEFELFVLERRILTCHRRIRRAGQRPTPRIAMETTTPPDAVARLAVEAIAAFPGTSYGTVRVVQGLEAPGEVMVDGIDVDAPAAVVVAPEELARIADAVVAVETAATARSGRRERTLDLLRRLGLVTPLRRVRAELRRVATTRRQR
jgi:hypothetical protein